MAGKLLTLFRCLMSEMVRSFFRFYGTNAYWLQMTTDADMDLTFHDIATANFRVVRTWAFNDVSSKPSSGTYFQVMRTHLFFLFHLCLIPVTDPEWRSGHHQRRSRWSTAARQTSGDR